MNANIKPVIRDTSGQDIVREPAQRQRINYKWLVITIATVVLLLILASTMRTWFSAEATVSADRIRTANVQRGSFIRDVGIQGRIVAANSPTLYSPANGTVTLLVQPGDSVDEQQIIATMASPEIQSEFEQGQANLETLTAQLERQRIVARQSAVRNQQTIDLAQVKLTAAEREMQRAELSIEISAISQIDYETYKDELATAQVEHKHAIQDAGLDAESLEFDVKSQELALRQQQLLVNNLQRRIDDLNITSPVTGIVGNVAIEQKAVVDPNEPLITVVDLTAFEVEVRIPETYADDLSIGMNGEVQYNGQTFAASLTSLSPQVIDSEVVGRMRFAASPPDGIRQNQRVTARIIIDQFDDVLKLRRGAFTDSGGGHTAFVLGTDGLARRRAIELGARSVSEVQVLSGLEEGERVVISSISEFQDQDLIQVVD